MSRPVPEVRGEGVLLTGWRAEDAPAVAELADDEQTQTWSASLRPVRTAQDALVWIASRVDNADRYDWAVRDPATGRLIGRVGLHRFDHLSRNAEIGYGVHPAHRRGGVAARAVGAASEHGFRVLGLARIALVHALGNTASCAVAARSGYAYEGLNRALLDHGDGVLHDAHLHARLADDPPGRADPAPAPLDVPVLCHDDLRLRPWEPADAAVYLRGLTDPEAARWYPLTPPTTTDDALRLIARMQRRAREGHSLAWAVEVGGRLAGSVGLRAINRVDGWVNASYWVLPELRRRGVATRALGVAAAYAFDGLGLHRVQLQHAVANTASCRVAERAGFVLESVQRQSVRLGEGYVDEHQHVRLAP